MNARQSAPDRESRARLAEDRTEYAGTVLANERTCSAWIRTGLAALAAGLAFVRFLGDELPAWIVHATAGILILCAIAAFGFAAWRYRNLDARIRDARVPSIPFPFILALTGLLVLTALLGLFGLWLG